MGDIREEILELLEKYVDADRNVIGNGSRIYHDLGLSGVDFYDFIVNFSVRFSVDLSGMDAREFGPVEMGTQVFKKRFFELRVSDLEELAACGSWAASGLENRLSKS